MNPRISQDETLPRPSAVSGDDPTRRLRARIRFSSNSAPTHPPAGQLSGHLVDWRHGTFVFTAANPDFVLTDEFPLPRPGQRVSLAMETTRPGQPYQMIAQVVSLTHRPFDDTVYLRVVGNDPVAEMLASHFRRTVSA